MAVVARFGPPSSGSADLTVALRADPVRACHSSAGSGSGRYPCPESLDQRRRFFAEEIQAVCNLRTAGLVEALATVPREAFLPPGPWTIRAEGDYGEPPRQTPDADPRHVYHNISVAIDPARMLFNGAPSVVAMCIDRLALAAGSVGAARRNGPRLLHRADGRDGRKRRAGRRRRGRSGAGRNVAREPGPVAPRRRPPRATAWTGSPEERTTPSW